MGLGTLASFALQCSVLSDRSRDPEFDHADRQVQLIECRLVPSRNRKTDKTRNLHRVQPVSLTAAAAGSRCTFSSATTTATRTHLFQTQFTRSSFLCIFFRFFSPFFFQVDKIIPTIAVRLSGLYACQWGSPASWAYAQSEWRLRAIAEAPATRLFRLVTVYLRQTWKWVSAVEVGRVFWHVIGIQRVL